jgi:hypothetical protein
LEISSFTLEVVRCTIVRYIEDDDTKLLYASIVVYHIDIHSTSYIIMEKSVSFVLEDMIPHIKSY